MNAIEPAKTQWASPVILAPNKDGTLRFCVDYRKLNVGTTSDSYPSPRMDECIESLGDAQAFSFVDEKSANRQIEVDRSDREKTAFTSQHGLQKFTCIPFSVKKAPTTSQRHTEFIPSSVKYQFALVYLDYIVTF